MLVCGFSVAFFSFLPASNLFFPVGFVVAERVLYIPSMGFCMLVAEGVYTILKTQRLLLSRSAKLGLILLFVFHATKTVTRNREWKDERTLYLSAVQSYPTNNKMWHNLASKFANDYLYTSEAMMRRSIDNDPYYIVAHTDLGGILIRQNRLQEAEKVRKYIQLLE